MLSNIFSFFKSTRSILAVIFGVTIPVALMTRIITGDQFMVLAGMVIGSYFSRKDTSDEENKQRPFR